MLQHCGAIPPMILAFCFLLQGFAPMLLAETAEATAEADAFQLKSFSPQGSVKDLGDTQIRAEFSQDLVPFGSADVALEPFKIDCALKGQGRWIDARTWVYEFSEKPAKAGIACRFTLDAALKSLDGKALADAEQVFSIAEGDPKVLDIRPYPESTGIDENQAFVVAFDLGVEREAFLRSAHFKVKGIESRIGVEILPEAAAEAILKSSYFYGASKDGPKLVFKPKQTFPQDSEVQFVWPGSAGASDAKEKQSEKDKDGILQAFRFTTRPAFRISISCSRESADAPCNPLSPLTISLTSPISAANSKKIRLQVKGGGKELNPNTYDYQIQDDAVSSLNLAPPLPVDTALILEVPPELKDRDGRKLANQEKFPLQIVVGPYPPLAKFAAQFGIVEWGKDAALPLTVRNLDPDIKAKLASVRSLELDWVGKGKILLNRLLRRGGNLLPEQKTLIVRTMQDIFVTDYERESRSESLFRNDLAAFKTEPLTVPKEHAIKELEVVGIPLKAPGFYVAEIESEKLARSLIQKPDKPRMYVPTAALVTSLAVHLKVGRENALVWVSSLEDAEPVAKAKIDILDASGKSLWQGETGADGVAMIKAELKEHLEACNEGPQASPYHCGLFAFASKGDDMSFTHSSWDRGIENWRFDSYRYDTKNIPLLAHAVLDRSLFLPGETLSYKVLLRDHGAEGLRFPQRAADYPYLLIRHEGSEETVVRDAKWDGQGSFDGSWDIPKKARLGSYSIYVSREREFSYEDSIQAAAFSVEEFSLPLMSGTLSFEKEPKPGSTSLPLEADIRYLAGGGASGLPVKLHVEVLEVRNAFQLPARPKKEKGRKDKGGNEKGKDEDPDSSLPDEKELPFHFDRGSALKTEHNSETSLSSSDQALTLDGEGLLKHRVAELPASDETIRVKAELEYTDPNGEIRQLRRSADIASLTEHLGIRTPSWMPKSSDVEVEALAVEASGKPISGRELVLTSYKRSYISHRKKLAGGVYAYDNKLEITPQGEFCRGKTDQHGRLICKVELKVRGDLYVEAELKTASGKVRKTFLSLWLPGDSEWWNGGSDSDRMDLTPEKKEYAPGENARLQVGMPFRKAKVLLTVEREGVLDYSVASIDAANPLLTLPIKASYAPNVFISALAVRGRTGDSKPTALVDLDKPAYKVGIAELQVDWGRHRLKVDVKPQKELYSERETAIIDVVVTDSEGKTPGVPGEIAIAAVDAGLLELQANPTWETIGSFMNPRNNEVQTSTAQMQIVGKRHFGLKALPEGGDGAMMKMADTEQAEARENFSSLLRWIARAPLGADGKARIEIPLSDALSAFEIAAVATVGADRFGLGKGRMRVSKDVLVYAGLPLVAREGDHIEAAYTFKNNLKKAAKIKASLKVEENPALAETMTLEIPAGESRTKRFGIDLPQGLIRGDEVSVQWTFEMRAEMDGKEIDRLKTKQTIVPSVPLLTEQAEIAAIAPGKAFTLPYALPDGADPTRGGLTIALSTSLAGTSEGVQDYMRAYPYACLEQQISKAVASGDRKAWDALAADMHLYLDRQDRLSFFPGGLSGSESLNAYVLRVSNLTSWPLAAALQERLAKGLRNFLEGRSSRDREWEQVLQVDRRLDALDALSRVEKIKDAQVDPLAVRPLQWNHLNLVNWLETLDRSPQLKKHAAWKKEAETALAARLIATGSAMRLRKEGDARYYWLMMSESANLIRVLLRAIAIKAPREEAAALLRGMLASQTQGHWGLTTANALGSVALRLFAEAYEKEGLSGKTSASFAGGQKDVVWDAKAAKVQEIQVPWPSASSETQSENPLENPPEDPGSVEAPKRASELKLVHEGKGEPWALIRSQAAVKLQEAREHGFKIEKEESFVRRQQEGKTTVGDIIRVRLKVESHAEVNWVVIHDALPPGGQILGRGLGGETELRREEEASGGSGAWWSQPTFVEKGAESMRAYYEWAPAGQAEIVYHYRLNHAGRFERPPTHVEAMYFPEMSGDLPNPALVVEAAGGS